MAREKEGFISRAARTTQRVKEWTARVWRAAGNAALIAGLVAGIAAMRNPRPEPKPAKSPKRGR